MTDQIRPPGGGNREGASNIISLFSKNKKNNIPRRPHRQSLSPSQRRDFLAEISTFLRLIPNDGQYNIRPYLWQLVQQDMQEVSK